MLSFTITRDSGVKKKDKWKRRKDITKQTDVT